MEIRRRAIRRMIIVVWSGCHIWRGCTWWKGVVLCLTWRRLLRRNIVILMVHVVLLTWIRHVSEVNTTNRRRRRRRRRIKRRFCCSCGRYEDDGDEDGLMKKGRWC